MERKGIKGGRNMKVNTVKKTIKRGERGQVLGREGGREGREVN